ncbi:rhodanese-like domain-containing protein [Psychroflexus aestuariivivens]|uniref:rhodanese-like domain-containing protein n=1 Tax=Psychroflexus aestuariivivens TaxID=1795040 RepID=UPI000FDB96AC|nr:rhodanese-like domain-containing protein [Psychroflexus aestuariivivens]
MKNLEQKQWIDGLQKDKSAVILDVRTPEEFEEGFIKDAKLINIQNPETFMSEIEKLDKSTPHYVYCRSGKRSEMACQIMEKSGFEKTYNLSGGILEWRGDVETK